MGKMKTTFKPRSLTRSLMALFAPKKRPSAHQRLPDAYYKPIWFDKKMFDGIQLVAKIEKLSKKKATRFLLEKGFRNYIGEKLHEAIKGCTGGR